MLAGRILAGIGIGLSSALVPVYISEASQSQGGTQIWQPRCLDMAECSPAFCFGSWQLYILWIPLQATISVQQA